MIQSRFTHGLSILAIGLSFTAAVPAARAENPLEKLHRHIFGELFGSRDDDRKDHDKKKRHRDDDRRCESPRDERDRGSYGGFAPGYIQGPVIEAQIYERHYDASDEPAPRSSSQPVPLEADVQAALQRDGYYRGPIDGDLNPSTRAAIRDYQDDHRLAPTGRINRDLIRSLGL
jgi:hypothetical protein